MAREERGALLALGFLLAVTALWWALALWPSGGPTPEWLARARYVCFNAASDGLPDASGWLLLIGQPIGMFAALMAVAGASLRRAFASLRAARAGRIALVAGALACAAGLAAAGSRVAALRAAGASDLAREAPLPDTYPRLDRPAPSLALVDQRGERVDLSQPGDRTTFVTFAFGNCRSVCPAVVEQVRAARARIRAQSAAAAEAPRIAIVVLDPWRDTPPRLDHLAEHWKLETGDLVLGGSVEEVGAALDAWQVPHERDPRTGDVSHPPLVYLLGRDGRIVYAATGNTGVLAQLAARVEGE